MLWAVRPNQMGYVNLQKAWLLLFDYSEQDVSTSKPKTKNRWRWKRPDKDKSIQNKPQGKKSSFSNLGPIQWDNY